MRNDADIRGAVIVAGGSGRRMGGGVPKQFLPLGPDAKPVIVHTVERFAEALPEGSPIVVVAAAGETARLRAIALRYGIWERIRVCTGSDTRFASVRNGLREIECAFVAIHDGVRPLVSRELIVRAFAEAEEYGSAIPCVRPNDTFRMDSGDGTTRPCDREKLMAIQTPQVFRLENIRAAYDMAAGARFTDDAGVYEAAGFRLHMIGGDRRNIKITTPSDLAVANALITFAEPE